MTLRATVSRWIAISFLAVLAVQPLPAAAPTARPIADIDLLKFTWIADPQVAPDGAAVAFVRVTIDQQTDAYETELWLVPTDGSAAPRQYTSGPRDSSPRWSPDGSRLVFLRGVDNYGRAQAAQLHMISVLGGEAQPITNVPGGVGAAVWAPDGRSLAFVSTARIEEMEAEARLNATGTDDKRTESADDNDRARASIEEKGPEDAGSRPKSDVRVITRAEYRANGGGYPDANRPSHIWTVPIRDGASEAPVPTQLTRGSFDEQGLVWSADSSHLYFTSTRIPEPYLELPDSDLYVVPATGGEPRRVIDVNGPIANVSLSPDGTRAAYTGFVNEKHDKSYSQPDLFVTRLSEDAIPKNLTAAYDFDIGAGLAGDQRAPRGSQPAAPLWNTDGGTVTIVSTERGRANLIDVDVESGRVTPRTSGDQEIISYTASRNGSALVALVSTPTNIGDLFLVGRAGTMTRLTNINERLFSDLQMTPPEEIWTTSFDGRRIQSWIQKPPDFDPGKKYPLILNIHGGPHAAYGYTFVHEFQWMAAQGYVVLAPNPRGSTLYGQEFANVIQYHYPGDDYKDLMATVDDVLKRGYIDPQRLGVTGGSGGGLLTNWIITQTDRFAAAVSQRSIADWAGFWYTADFTLFTPSWFKGAPWEDPQDFAARSPITFVKNVKTPLLLIEGEADLRTPSSDGGEQMFRALKYLKVPTAMVQFPGETHELSRSGKPWHRIDRLDHIVGWFDKYLKGKTVHAYDGN